MTKKVNVPETSRKAYKELHADQVERHRNLILQALRTLGSANADKIAQHLKMDHVQINRRTSELEARELIYKPGTESKTRTGRKAYDWKLTENGFLLSTPSVTDYTKKLLEKPKFFQRELF